MPDKKPEKPLPKPVWYKNTYFWIAGILFLLGVFGLPFLGGDSAIRDPGQKKEGWLFLLYFGAAAVMLVNGYISHQQTVQHYDETVDLVADIKEAKSVSTGETNVFESLGGETPTNVEQEKIGEVRE